MTENVKHPAPSSTDAARGGTPPAKPSPSALSDVENRMLLAAAAYLKEQGYHPVVISTARIQQNERLRVGNYELVLRFTGRKAALAKARGETDA